MKENLLHTWEDWLPHVASCIDVSVCESTGHTPHYIVYGQQLRLPNVLDRPQSPVYNADDYGKAYFQVSSDTHREVKTRLQESKMAMALIQHQHASPVDLQPGDSVRIQVPERRSKLSPKFEWPRLALKHLYGNKCKVFDSV